MDSESTIRGYSSCYFVNDWVSVTFVRDTEMAEVRSAQRRREGWDSGREDQWQGFPAKSVTRNLRTHYYVVAPFAAQLMMLRQWGYGRVAEA